MINESEANGCVSGLQTIALALEEEADAARWRLRHAQLVTEFDRAEGEVAAIDRALAIVDVHLRMALARSQYDCPECGNRPIAAPPAMGCKNALHLQADSLRRLREARIARNDGRPA
jgi:hypothetical protein